MIQYLVIWFMSWYNTCKTLTLFLFLSFSEIVPRDISMKDKFIEHFTGKQKSISVCFICSSKDYSSCVPFHPAMCGFPSSCLCIKTCYSYAAACYEVCMFVEYVNCLVIWPATIATYLHCAILHPTNQCTRPDLPLPVSRMITKVLSASLIIWLGCQKFVPVLHKTRLQK